MYIKPTVTALVTLVFGLALSSCGDDEAVSYSGDIGITLNLGSSDVDGTVLADAKNVTTESGNPCAEFVRLAEDRLGREPGGIRVDGVSVVLGDNPRDVTNLSDLWGGVLTVSFVFDDDAELAVASIAAPASAGPVDLAVSVTQAQLGSRLSDLVACGYSVRASGAVADGLSNTFDASVTVTLRMAALE